MINNFDVVLVIAAMLIGFSVILMHLTGLWPCTIIQKMDKLSVMNYSNGLTMIGREPLKSSIGEIHYLLTNLFRCK